MALGEEFISATLRCRHLDVSVTPHSLYTSRREQALLGCNLTWFRSILEEKMSYALLFTEGINQFYDDTKKCAGGCPFLIWWVPPQKHEPALWQTAGQEKPRRSEKGWPQIPTAGSKGRFELKGWGCLTSNHGPYKNTTQSWRTVCDSWQSGSRRFDQTYRPGTASSQESCRDAWVASAAIFLPSQHIPPWSRRERRVIIYPATRYHWRWMEQTLGYV